MASYINLTSYAWRQLRRSWAPRSTASLEFQTHLYGPLHSALNSVQSLLVGRKRAAAPLEGAVFILGVWRSGTTLLHELLCTDDRFGFPTSLACFNPHHFVLTHARALAQPSPKFRRAADQMMISVGSPQEDEFALLCLGARSPYEGMLVPARAAQAYALADPADLTPRERAHWRKTFVTFLRGVSLVSGGRPLVLKSPTHSYRVATLRELLPDARFILIVRNPYEVFESMFRTSQALNRQFGLEPPMPDDQLRELILSERLRFEARLQAGVAGLPARQFATVTYEQLVADPLSTIELLYRQLELPAFDVTREKLAAEVASRSSYVPTSSRPDARWTGRINEEWREVFERYGYERDELPRCGV